MGLGDEMVVAPQPSAKAAAQTARSEYVGAAPRSSLAGADVGVGADVDIGDISFRSHPCYKQLLDLKDSYAKEKKKLDRVRVLSCCRAVDLARVLTRSAGAPRHARRRRLDRLRSSPGRALAASATGQPRSSRQRATRRFVVVVVVLVVLCRAVSLIGAGAARAACISHILRTLGGAAHLDTILEYTVKVARSLAPSPSNRVAVLTHTHTRSHRSAGRE